MAMTTRGSVNHETRQDAPVGGSIVSTSANGASADDASNVPTQSPAGLQQSKPVAVVGSFSGGEGKQS